MLMARMLIVLLLLAFSTTAQNYTIELERVIPGAEHYTRMEPVVADNGHVSWLVAIDGSIYRYVAHDLGADTSFVYPTTGPPGDMVFVPKFGPGIQSIVLAYHQGGEISVGRMISVGPTTIFDTLEVPFLGFISGYGSILEKCYIEPLYQEGELISLAVGAVWVIGAFYTDSGVEEWNTCWWAEVEPSLNSVIRQRNYFHVHKGDMTGDSNPEYLTYIDNYAYLPYYTEWGWLHTTTYSSDLATRSHYLHVIDQIVTTNGSYNAMFVDNMNRVDDYDEIIYEGNAIPLDNSGNKKHHVGCFSMANGPIERVWYREDLAGLSHYYEPENLLVLLNSVGSVTLVSAETGEITDSYDLGRPLTATRVFTNQATNTLGLVGRVADTVFVYNFGSPTPVEEEPTTLPSSFTLAQNYPNPFNPSTTISFYLDQPGVAQLEIFNVMGQKVTTLADQFMTAGEHQVVWEGTDSIGNEVASGVYLYRLKAGDISETRKMILLK